MDSIWRMAHGSSTAIQDFAKEVYIKSNLTTELSRNVKSLQKEHLDDKQITSDSSAVSNLCNTIEAILLHGLKEKLKSRVTSVFSSNSFNSQRICQLDFWPVILILCHNNVSQSLVKLRNISTDIGRCRAWLRSALNDCLITSYIEAIINDPSLLYGFYRSSAYLRDKEHTDLLKHLLDGLDAFTFHLVVDCPTLNLWSWETLSLIGINYVQEEPTPVMTAVDAIQLINDNNKTKKKEPKKKQDNNNDVIDESVKSNLKAETVKSNIELLNEDLLFPNDNVDINSECEEKLTENELVDLIEEHSIENKSISSSSDLSSVNEKVESGNSLNRMSGWSSVPPVRKVQAEINEESYDTLIKNYSSHTILSSTPDIRDFNNIFKATNNKIEDEIESKESVKPTVEAAKKPSTESASDLDFEIIPKSIVLNNSDPETHRFLSQVTKLANEFGLDEQDYKCASCARPIGMIYGKSRLCHFDGYQYCLECHVNDEILIPARIIFNWNFKKYPVAKRNKHLLHLTESEPLFDIKLLSPILYSLIPEMEHVLELRTQLFYLHAYLFTCQESIANELRKMVWPREHLFEHIHQYSTADLIQVNDGTLIQTLKKVITFARKHVSSCPLCTLKGFYCEICKSSQILYPFDTDFTKRCEKCKTVFHSKCYIETYDEISCPKCLRIKSREEKITSQ